MSDIQVFISHSSQEADFAKKIVNLLRSAFGLKKTQIICTSIDGLRLDAGPDFVQQIRQHVEQARVMIGLLSPVALQSHYVLFETFARLLNERPFIPLVLPGSTVEDLPGMLSNHQAHRWEQLPQVVQTLEQLAGELGCELQPASEYADDISGLVFPALVQTQTGFATQLREDFDAFARGAAEAIHDEMQRAWLLAARLAIEEAAEVIENNWDRGQHSLSGYDLTPAERPRPGWFPLFTEVVSRKVVAQLEKLSGPLACRIVTDDHGVVSKKKKKSDFTWVVDAIDGSRQMVRSLPLFMSTITLIDSKCRPILALLYAPVTGELFFAVKNQGAYLNSWETPLELGDLCDVSEAGVGKRRRGAMKERAIVHVEFPNSSTKSSKDFQRWNAATTRIMETVHRVRGLGVGSLGLAYTAKGAFDAYVTFASGTLNCDVLAGELLVTAAGGVAYKQITQKDKEPALSGALLIAGRPDVVELLLDDAEIGPLFKQAKP